MIAATLKYFEIHIMNMVQSRPEEWDCEFEFYDSGQLNSQKEKIVIPTRIAGPFSDHPHAKAQAALLRARELIDEKILEIKRN